MKTHPFVEDPALPADIHGRRVCVCGLLEPNRAHDLPERDEEQRAVEARRVGEEA